MDYSKIKKIIFILLSLFIVFLPFFLVGTFCIETVDVNEVQGLRILNSYNYFISDSSFTIGYFEVDKNFSYTITNNSQYNRELAYSDTIPEVNVTYTFIKTLAPGESYSFIFDEDTVIYYSFSQVYDTSVTRTPLNGQTEAVNNLVDNVGISQIWDIFDISINYIVVVVLVVFGIFIIFRIIKKISKGKEGF